MQALAQQGMAPKFLAYIDNHGRPLWCVLVQLIFGLLGYVGTAAKSSEVFTWLLAISGLSYFFIWGSICLTHIRFRYVWKAQGYTLDQIPYKPGFGVWGSWIGLGLNFLCLIATFYSALYVSRIRPCSSVSQLGTLQNANPFYSHRPTRLLTSRCSSNSTSRHQSSLHCTWVGRCTPRTGGSTSPLMRLTSRAT
jgi:amino acid permease